MSPLFDFLRRYAHVALFVVLEAVSLTLLLRFNTYQGNVWLSGANRTAAAANRLYTETEAFLALRGVNAELTHQNVLLMQQNDRLRQALCEATHDSTRAELELSRALAGFRQIPAHVVANSHSRADNYLVIDRGEQDGVRPEMGVVGGGGVVGIVYLCGERHSLVLPVTNRKSSISCRVRGQRYFGYMQWDGTDMRRAYVDDIPRYAHLRGGDIIETSGYSAVFPPGLFVGRVKRVRNSSDGQSYRLDVQLGADLARLSDVAVVATPYKAEIDTLRAHAALGD